MLTTFSCNLLSCFVIGNHASLNGVSNEYLLENKVISNWKMQNLSNSLVSKCYKHVLVIKLICDK